MKGFIAKYYSIFFVILILAIAGFAFYVGMLYGQGSQKSGVELRCSPDMLSSLHIPLGTRAEAQQEPQTAQTGTYAGSKNGTKYYTPGCAGLDRIKPENIIWFQSQQDAELQGYTPASC